MQTAWRRSILTGGMLVVAAVATVPAATGGQRAAAQATPPVPTPATTPATTPSAPATTPARGVRRQRLGAYGPINAPGQRMAIERITVAPGAKIPRHAHVGTVMLHADRGRARFEIHRGSVVVTERGGDTRTVVGPASLELTRGMTVVEQPLGVYSGENRARRSFVASLATLDAQLVPGPVAPEGVETPAITLAAEILSTESTLANADPSLRYGWNHLVGNASVGSETVLCDMLGNVAYVTGAGPFFGFVTFTWPDGSALVTEMFGESIPQADGGAGVRAVLTIIGGTGRYSAARGFGSFDGVRDATVGAPVRSVFTLTPVAS